MKKTKYIVPALALPALALTFFGASAVSAMGNWKNINPEEVVKHQQQMFEHQADLLGINISEVKDAWANGKNIKDIAKEKGISEGDLQAKMKAARKQQQQERLKALVSAGVITQAQADQRLQFEEQRPQKIKRMGFQKQQRMHHEGGREF